MITRKGYRKYRIIIQEKEVNQILDNGELQENYITRVDEVENTTKQVVKIKTKDPRPGMHKIQQKRKKVKNETKDHQKQTRKIHTVGKSKDPERADRRQNKREYSNTNYKGCILEKE